MGQDRCHTHGTSRPSEWLVELRASLGAVDSIGAWAVAAGSRLAVAVAAGSRLAVAVVAGSRLAVAVVAGSSLVVMLELRVAEERVGRCLVASKVSELE